MIIRCKLGFHNWKYRHGAEYNYETMRIKGYYATCRRCGKEQYFTPYGWMDI